MDPDGNAEPGRPDQAEHPPAWLRRARRRGGRSRETRRTNRIEGERKPTQSAGPGRPGQLPEHSPAALKGVHGGFARGDGDRRIRPSHGRNRRRRPHPLEASRSCPKATGVAQASVLVLWRNVESVDKARRRTIEMDAGGNGRPNGLAGDALRPDFSPVGRLHQLGPGRAAQQLGRAGRPRASRQRMTLQSGNAFSSPATPSSVSFVAFRNRNRRAVSPRSLVSPASVIVVPERSKMSSFANP